MQSHSKIIRDLSQSALAKKYQLFLSQLTFIDPAGKVQTETFPAWAHDGVCAGYSFMSSRALLIQDHGRYQYRLNNLADANNVQVIQMGILLQRYRDELAKKSLTSTQSFANRHAEIMQSWSKKECDILTHAQDLYIFINSLLVAQQPEELQEHHETLPNYEHKGKLNQTNYTELLKLMPSDAFFEEKGICDENNISPIKQTYVISFNFTEAELLHTLESLLHDQDIIRIANAEHVGRLFVNKQEHLSLSLLDPNNKSGEQTFRTLQTFLNADIFKDSALAYEDPTLERYFSIDIMIFSTDALRKRPLPTKIIADILSNRGKNNHINAQGADGSTGLAMAAHSGCTDIVKLLLANGADPNIADNSKYTPAMLAAAEGYSDIIRALAEFNADLDHASAQANSQCYHGTAQVVRDCEDESNQAHLRTWAARLNLPEFVNKSTAEIKFALEEKTTTDAQECTLNVLQAVRSKNHGALKLLLQAQSTVNIRKIAIYFAVTAQDFDANLLQFICETGVVFGQINRHYAIACLIALQEKQFPIALTLIEKHADNFTKNQLGFALICLITAKQFNIAKTLLQKRPDTNKVWTTQDGKENNSLHMALLLGSDFELIELLCAQNTAIGALNMDRKTALSLAIEKGNLPVARYFLSYFSQQFSQAQLEQAALGLLSLQNNRDLQGQRQTIEALPKKSSIKLSAPTLLKAQQKFAALNKISNKKRLVIAEEQSNRQKMKLR